MGLFKINAQLVIEGRGPGGRPIYGLRAHRGHPGMDDLRTYELGDHLRLKRAAAQGAGAFNTEARRLLGDWFDGFDEETQEGWFLSYQAD